MKVRVKFSKHGVVKYIGHLDIMRYFQKAIRRADIPVKYSGGFSPHQIISFAQPLGVGVESDGEYFDMELEGEQDLVAMKKQLNEAMVEGIAVLEVVALGDNAKNAMASIAAAAYRVDFREGKLPAFDLAKTISELMAKDTIPYLKKTKKNEIAIDLKQGIFALYEKEQSVYMTVDASSGGNIKPSVVMEVLYREAGQEMPEFALAITRLEIYQRNDQGALCSLGEMDETNA